MVNFRSPGFSQALSDLLSRKPLPLTTVELQKAGSRLLKLAPKRVLDVITPSDLTCTYLTVP